MPLSSVQNPHSELVGALYRDHRGWLLAWLRRNVACPQRAEDLSQDTFVRLLGRTLYIGHDFRAYYHLRNSMAMALRAPIAWPWRLDQLLKMPLYLVLYTAFAEGGSLRMARLLLRALRDGVMGHMGKLNINHRA